MKPAVRPGTLEGDWVSCRLAEEVSAAMSTKETELSEARTAWEARVVPVRAVTAMTASTAKGLARCGV